MEESPPNTVSLIPEGVPAPHSGGLVDKVIAAASFFSCETGRMPTVVYLGRYELRCLWDLCHYIRGQPYCPDQIQETKLCGYRVIGVQEAHYLAVG